MQGAIEQTPQLSRSNPTWRGRAFHVAVLLSAVAVLNFLDLEFTLFAQNIQELNEMNPLVAVFAQNGLIASLFAYKVLMVLCSLGILWKLRESRLTVPACWTLLLAYVALGLIWYAWVSNVNEAMELHLASATVPPRGGF